MHRAWAGLAGAAWLLLAAPPSRMHAAEGPAAFEVRCAEGKLTLAAEGAPAGRVFALLGRECGVELRRADLLSDRVVTAAYREAPLEEAVRDLVRLTGLAGSLRVSTATGAMTVFLLPAGTGEAPAASADPKSSGGSSGGTGGSRQVPGPRPALSQVAGGDAPPEAAAAEAPAAWPQALTTLARLSTDEAWVLRNLDPEDFAEERLAATAAQARRRFLLGETEAERQDGLHALRQLDPDEAAKLGGADQEQLDDLREAQAAEEARNAYLLASTPQEQELALAGLLRLDPFEARELTALPPELHAEERQQVAVKRAKRDYYLSLTPEEQQRLFREARKRLPE